LLNGEGEMIFSNGDNYKGEFKDNLRMLRENMKYPINWGKLLHSGIEIN
jgi:hypothetical protein